MNARNLSIDCLRGASILAVLLLHYGMHLPSDFSPVSPDIVSLIMRNGFYGVTVFFVISGFLITSHAIKRYGSLAAVSPREFYIARAARILPLLTACVVTLVLLHLAGLSAFRAPETLSIFGVAWSALTFQFNWYFLLGGNVPGLASWGPLWSLSVEEIFYVIFPVVCLALRSEKSIAALLIVVIVQAPFVRFDWGNVYLLTGCADAIAMGCLAAIVAAHSLRLPLWSGWTMQAVGLGIIVWRYSYAQITVDHIIGPSVIALGAAIFLLGAGVSARSANLSRIRVAFFPLQILGRRSYEIYLLHMPLLVALQTWGVGPQPGRHPILMLTCFLILIGAIGELVGRCFTDPITKLARAPRVDRHSSNAEPAALAIAG